MPTSFSVPKHEDKPKIQLPVALQSADIQMLYEVRNELIILTCVESTVHSTWKGDQWQ